MFDEAKYIGGICVPGCADYSRKQLNELTDFVKRPQVGAKGLVYIKYNADGTVKSSIDKFYSPEELAEIKTVMGAKDGDLVLILSGDNANKTRIQLCSLRLEMGFVIRMYSSVFGLLTSLSLSGAMRSSA